MHAADLFIAFLNISLAILLLQRCYIWRKHHQNGRRLIALPWIVYALHWLVFYVVTALALLAHSTISVFIGIDQISRYWSVILRIHAGTTFIVSTFILESYHRRPA